MKPTALLASALILFFISAGFADDTPITNRDDAEALISTFKYQKGLIPLKGSLAQLNVPDNFRYLGPDDAQAVLVRLWHNPPGPEPLGLILPAYVSPIDPDCWAVTIEYLEEGHVKDDDAAKIDYGSMLTQMKQQAEDSNKERTSKGYPAIELVGWAEPPRYDPATHKLFWAKELSFAGQPVHTLNYNIRVLGRKGLLLLNVIGSMSQLPDIQKAAPEVISMVDFQKGNRYADFDSSTDKLATYGIAALVAGGVAAKMGLFKVVWIALLAAKKFVIIGLAAISSWFKKLFKKKEKNPAPAAVESPPPTEN